MSLADDGSSVLSQSSGRHVHLGVEQNCIFKQLRKQYLLSNPFAETQETSFRFRHLPVQPGEQGGQGECSLFVLATNYPGSQRLLHDLSHFLSGTLSLRAAAEPCYSHTLYLHFCLWFIKRFVLLPVFPKAVE
jgi:hypothetical protein